MLLRSTPNRVKPARSRTRREAGLSIAGVRREPVQPEPAVLGVDERVPHGEPAGLGGHPAAAGERVHPVADLGLAAGLRCRNSATQPSSSSVSGSATVHVSDPPRAPSSRCSSSRSRAFASSWGACSRRLWLYLCTCGSLPPSTRRGMSASAVARSTTESPTIRGARSHVRPRRHRLTATQRARPRVDQPVALLQPGAQRPVEAEAEPPREPARGPVAAAGQPDHRLQVALGEAPLQEQSQRALHHAAAADPGVGRRRRPRRDPHPRCAARWCRRTASPRRRPRPPPRSPTPGRSPSRRG